MYDWPKDYSFIKVLHCCNCSFKFN